MQGDEVMGKDEDLKRSCISSEKLENYLSKKGKNHNNYKCYGEMERIIQIRDDKSMYLVTGSRWNDKTDKENFNNTNYEYVNFGKCFSFSRDENVALWMLYGGMKKEGGMIDFTKKGMNSILAIPSVEIGYFNNNNFVKINEIAKDKFDIFITDVIYYSENSKYYYVKRGDESFKILRKSILDTHKIIKKVYPWNYENECRLVVSINKKYICEQCECVKINLKNIDLGKSLERIYKSPNYCSNKKYENVMDSKLATTLNWDLCYKCKEIKGAK